MSYTVMKTKVQIISRDVNKCRRIDYLKFPDEFVRRLGGGILIMTDEGRGLRPVGSAATKRPLNTDLVREGACAGLISVSKKSPTQERQETKNTVMNGSYAPGLFSLVWTPKL